MRSRMSARVRCTVLFVAAVVGVASCGSSSKSAGSGASSSTTSPSSRTTPATRAVVPIDAGQQSANAACALISATDVAAATGETAGTPQPSGYNPAGPGGMALSRCDVNVTGATSPVTVEVEHYPTITAAVARFSQVDHPDFAQLPGVADGAFTQADVLAGVRHGADIAFVSGPRSAPVLARLARAVAANFGRAGSAGGAPKPGPGDPDPCGLQQSVPLPRGATLTRVARAQPTAPFAWACVYSTSNPSYTLRVQTTTSQQLADAGLPTADKVLAQLAPEAGSGAEKTVVAADGTNYRTADAVPSGTPFDVDIAGGDTLIQYVSLGSKTPNRDQLAMIMQLDPSECRDLIQDFQVRGNLPFSDAALAGMIQYADLLRDCYYFLYGKGS